MVYSITLGVMLINPVAGSCVKLAAGTVIGVAVEDGTVRVPLV